MSSLKFLTVYSGTCQHSGKLEFSAYYYLFSFNIFKHILFTVKIFETIILLLNRTEKCQIKLNRVVCDFKNKKSREFYDFW